MVRQRIIRLVAVSAERTQRDVNGLAMPVAAVGVRNEAQLVDASDEGAAEEQIDECDEAGGAPRGGQSD